MSEESAVEKLRARWTHHKGRRPAPGNDERVDVLLGMVMALTSEVSILRDRLDTHERLSEAGQTIAQGQIDNYEPDDDAQQQRAAERKRLIDKVCRPLFAGTD